jgi:hypothetical protein
LPDTSLLLFHIVDTLIYALYLAVADEDGYANYNEQNKHPAPYAVTQLIANCLYLTMDNLDFTLY